MGWWWTGRKAAPDARPFVPAWLTNESAEVGFARSYQGQFEEVYRKNPVGQRAVRLVAGMLGSLTIDAIEGDERAAKLVQADGLLESIAANLLLHGNAYVQLIADGRDVPSELCLLRPERVSVVSDEHGWPVAYLYRAGGQRSVVRTAARKSKLGRAATDLPVGQPYEITDFVDVDMVDASQWLVGCDDDALAAGANMAILGGEIIQFGDADPIGPGRFRLGRLVRARENTAWAMDNHKADEWFVLIERDALRLIELPPWSIGLEVAARVIGAELSSPETQVTVGPESLPSLRGSALILEGQQVVGARSSAIPSPTGGSMVDSEARTAIDDVLAALRQHGLIEM